MTDCLVFQFRAPNGMGLNPQTVERIEQCVNGNRDLEVWQQLETMRDELIAKNDCGIWQLDGVDENPVDGWEPNFHNSWAKLQIGEVVTDDHPVDLTAPFTAMEVRIEGDCKSPNTPTPPADNPPADTPVVVVTPPTPIDETPVIIDESSLGEASHETPIDPMAPAPPVEPSTPLLVPLPTVPAVPTFEPVQELPEAPTAVPVAVAGVSATRLPATGSGLDIEMTAASGIATMALGLVLVVATAWRKFHKSSLGKD